MSRKQEQNLVWRRQDAIGLEQLHLLMDEKGATADGLVMTVENGKVVRLRYLVHCDPEWQCRRAELEILGSPNRKVTLAKEPGADWLNNGQAIAGSKACTDIDISATPFTNTLPIRRLNLSPGQAAEISALYILVPDLAVTVVAQTYRCIETSGKQSIYTYRGLDDREYRVNADAEGLVTDYEGLFKRILG